MQSGDLQYGLDQADTQKEQLQYDLSNQFMNTAQKSINDYVQGEANRRMQEAQAIWAAEQAVMQWWRPPGGGAAGGETAPPSGQTWYRDPQTGEVYSLPG